MVDDKRLIWRVRRGDKQALRQIYEKYKDELFTIAYLLLNDKSAAEEILHNVFVAFAGGAGQFRLYGSLKYYLITRVVNSVRQSSQEKMYQVVEVDRSGRNASEPAGGEQEVLADESSELLIEALSKLPFSQREVIILHLLGSMKFREIAGLQDITLSTAESRYRYGLDKVHSVLHSEVKE
jgi:RNA polymerase sigma-70 factor (ECF subfamily)